MAAKPPKTATKTTSKVKSPEIKVAPGYKRVKQQKVVYEYWFKKWHAIGTDGWKLKEIQLSKKHAVEVWCRRVKKAPRRK